MRETRDALEALWRETTKKPLWLPPHLWRYLRLRRRVRLKMLVRDDLDVLPPPRGLPNCRACTDVCCIGKKNQVSLRLVDIAMLMDLGRTDLIARGERFAVLKQDGNERCLALGQDRRCTLFPTWPLSCARFPYSLDFDDREIFYSPRCPSYQVVQTHPRIEGMIDAAIATYNERIRDWILTELAWDGLVRLGLSAFLVKR